MAGTRVFYHYGKDSRHAGGNIGELQLLPPEFKYGIFRRNGQPCLHRLIQNHSASNSPACTNSELPQPGLDT